MDKKGESSTLSLVLVLLLAAVVLGMFGVIPMPFSTTGGGITTTTGGTMNVNVTGQCGVESTVLTLKGRDLFSSSTKILGNHQIAVQGSGMTGPDGYGNVANEGTKTVSPGDKVWVAFGDGNKSGQTTAFTKLVEGYEIPCSGAVELGVELYRNGSETIRVFNEEGDLLSIADNVNETLAAADTVTLTGDIASQYERSWAPMGGVVCAERNSTVHDLTKVSFSGADSITASTPSFYKVGATDNTVSCFKFPAVISNAKVPMMVYMDVDDTNEPKAGAYNGGSDVRLTFYPYDYFLNPKTNTFEKAIEDQDGVQLSGRAAPAFNIEID